MQPNAHSAFWLGLRRGGGRLPASGPLPSAVLAYSWRLGTITWTTTTNTHSAAVRMSNPCHPPRLEYVSSHTSQADSFLPGSNMVLLVQTTHLLCPRAGVVTSLWLELREDESPVKEGTE
jgi:hypothetical protein